MTSLIIHCFSRATSVIAALWRNPPQKGVLFNDNTEDKQTQETFINYSQNFTILRKLTRRFYNYNRYTKQLKRG